MYYASTRGATGADRKSLAEVLLAGTAPNGGLYVPEYYPWLDLAMLRHSSFVALVVHIVCLFAGDSIPRKVVRKIAEEVFTQERFGTKKITPVTWLEPGLGLLELANGPTGAFKDLAMQLVARLINWVLEQQNRSIVVIVSTSGDTGGAAVEAFKGLSRIKLVVLFPEGRTSDIQRLMMTTAADENVYVLAVKSDFDVCQDIVKALFEDTALVERLGLTTVNSINWGRIVAQIVYWVALYFYATTHNSQRIQVSVPSGNFGDAYAAHGARQMGVPISRIIVATNVNDVLARVVNTGVYRKGERVIPTTSPSMDIQVASNFERLMFDASKHDGRLVADRFADLKKKGEFDASFMMLMFADGWAAGSASEENVRATIKSTYEKYNRLIDPHTAVAMFVAQQYRNSRTPMVVAETARPEKFPETMRDILGPKLVMPPRWPHLKKLPERVTRVAADVGEVKAYIMRLAA